MPAKPRALTVLVDCSPIEDGETPPPAVGEIGCYWLIFQEAGRDEHDATVSTFLARAEPLGDGAPYPGGYPTPGGEQPPVWPIRLHGEGWAATWSAPRPLVGQVALRGTLIGDFRCRSRVGVRGRITRARVVTETIDTTDPDQHKWCPIPDGLRKVETAPRWFDHGLVPPLDAPTTGWSRLVPADPYVRDVGVLVDLDLDDVPPLPRRPAIVPRALSASGADLWIADERLPLILRIRDRTGVTVFRWPGRILSEDEAPGRQLHADPGGCWVTGPDGIHRCDQDATVRLVREEHGWLAAATAGTLAAQVILEPGNARSPTALRLIEPSGAVIDVALDDCDVTSIAADDDGFVLMLRRRYRPEAPEEADRAQLARLAPTGRLVTGPILAPDTETDHDAKFGQLIGGGFMLILGSPRMHRVRPDLTLDQGFQPPRRPLAGWAQHDRLWIATHPPHPERSRHYLLTELDPTDLHPLTSTVIHQMPQHLTIDDQGTVWMESGGVHYCPAHEGTAEYLDAAALLTAAL